MIPRRLFILWTTALFCAAGLVSAKDATSKWEKEISAFETADKENPPKKGGILFTGSSSIRLWKTLAQDFPHHNVLNRGFGGSEISDAVQLFERIVTPYEPRTIVMYSGGNDINSGKSPEQVAGDFRTFTEAVRAKLPNTRIMYISITGNPARWKQVEKVKRANQMIQEYCSQTPGMTYIDVFTKMLGDDGKPRPEIFSKDGLHMNEKGYELWRDIVGPYLGPVDPDKADAPAPKTTSDVKAAAATKVAPVEPATAQ